MVSDDRDRTNATATVTSEEEPYGVRIDAGGHALRGDEPVGQGGADTGPPPFGLLLTGIAVTLTYVVKDKLAEIAEKTPVTRAVRAGTEIRTTTTDVR